MGQETSLPIDDSVPPSTLSSRTLSGIASHILAHPDLRIVVLTGAGISTSAGIPDFRSPNTGLYANLARLNLPYPEAVFDISFFKQNPEPFYALAHELYPGSGKFRPTVTHAFLRLLYEKGLLLKVFTQNIDCLERAAGVPESMIIEAHGSFATQSCVECRAPFDKEEMKQAIEDRRVPKCGKEGCGGLVKPDIVFFGEGLPEVFYQNRMLPSAADLAIVLGTSLSVQPFASLPGFVAEGVPRLLINQEGVGGLGSRADDVLALGECDEGVRKLASELGWLEELEELWKGMSPAKEEPKKDEAEQKSKDEELEDEVEKLTREVEKVMLVSKDHTERVQQDLEETEWEIVDGKGIPKTSPAEKGVDLEKQRRDSSIEGHDDKASTEKAESTNRPSSPDTKLDQPSKSKEPESETQTEEPSRNDGISRSAQATDESLK